MPGPYRDRAASTRSVAASSPDAAPHSFWLAVHNCSASERSDWAAVSYARRSRRAGERLAGRVRPGSKRLSVGGLADLRKTLLHRAKDSGEQRGATPIPLRRFEPANGRIQLQNPLAERKFPLGGLIGGIPAQGAAEGLAGGDVAVLGKLGRCQPGVCFRVAIVFRAPGHGTGPPIVWASRTRAKSRPTRFLAAASLGHDRGSPATPPWPEFWSPPFRGRRPAQSEPAPGWLPDWRARRRRSRDGNR